MDDSPYRSSAVSIEVAARGPLAKAIVLMATTGALLGITQLIMTVWAWRIEAVSQNVTLWIMLGNSLPYFVLAYGTYRRSRICACLLLLYSELHALLIVWLFSPLPAYALLAPLALLLLLVIGTQAVFRSHRF
ncbi:hypothetical protein [Stenotrophomonas sp. Iso1]|uniref:hypothetical protein n=1 Tax=Stenotrophomonas sp. Iso1 TaxID=2977283 RepID=UPI0022B79056|nr:hypothetical protein [Stenotrophomonas sp. Iso1]